MTSRAEVKREACQHCYKPLQVLPSEEPAAPDQAFDKTGSRVCMPRTGDPVLHKVMPRV